MQGLLAPTPRLSQVTCKGLCCPGDEQLSEVKQLLPALSSPVLSGSPAIACLWGHLPPWSITLPGMCPTGWAVQGGIAEQTAQTAFCSSF